MRTGKIGKASQENGPIVILAKGINIQQFSDELYVQIATVNANPNHIQRKIVYGKGERKTGHSRIFKTIGDFSFSSYSKKLVNPTIKIYREAKTNILPSETIKINHDNVSHTYRIGLIEKVSKQYRLTPLGECYLDGMIDAKTLFRKQLLRYSNCLEEDNNERTLFPYRTCFEILKRLNSSTPITFNEFAFCIYPIFDSSQNSIQTVIDDIGYLRDNYPKLDSVSDSNRSQILSELNAYYSTSFSETDIWGKNTTTVKNQFIYFRNHLSLFDEIIDIKHSSIYLKSGVTSADIDNLLNIDKGIEALDKPRLLAKYTEAPFLT